MRRVYKICVIINAIRFNEVIIDPHFELKHSKAVSDDIILLLIKELDGMYLEPDGIDSGGFKYFVTEPMFYKNKPYRLVWLIDLYASYIGILNCFRRPKK